MTYNYIGNNDDTTPLACFGRYCEPTNRIPCSADPTLVSRMLVMLTPCSPHQGLKVQTCRFSACRINTASFTQCTLQPNSQSTSSRPKMANVRGLDDLRDDEEEGGKFNEYYAGGEKRCVQEHKSYLVMMPSIAQPTLADLLIRCISLHAQQLSRRRNVLSCCIVIKMM